MAASINGLHHVTAVAGPAQRTLNFHTRVIPRRLVKTTVNFDAPDVYHLYYADAAGSPGTVLTVFPFDDAGPGRNGDGMASAFAYAVNAEGLAAAKTIAPEHSPIERFGETGVALRDPDGLQVELIQSTDGTTLDTAPFHSVTLMVRDPEPSARFLTEVFGFAHVGSTREGSAERIRFTVPTGHGRTVDLLSGDVPTLGAQGAGSIHHIAFRAADDDALMGWREKVADFGLSPTAWIDRQYFHSIYFREPGGILFEIATDPPGFAVDEPAETMGTALKLPPQYEERRAEIEAALPPLER